MARLSLLTLLVALIAAVTALQLNTPVAPHTAAAACSTAPKVAMAAVLDDALDNTDIPSDETLTPARGCKGCFG